jgi:hypothetical protein
MIADGKIVLLQSKDGILDLFDDYPGSVKDYKQWLVDSGFAALAPLDVWCEWAFNASSISVIATGGTPASGNGSKSDDRYLEDVSPFEFPNIDDYPSLNPQFIRPRGEKIFGGQSFTDQPFPIGNTSVHCFFLNGAPYVGAMQYDQPTSSTTSVTRTQIFSSYEYLSIPSTTTITITSLFHTPS